VDLLRISRDAYGREVLQGISWDLLWVFVGAGLALIVVHALYRALFASKQERQPK
jgi:formate dehydrogenase subunit gamma